MPKEASEWEGRAFLTRPPLQKTKQLGKCLQYRGKIPKKTIKLTLVGLNLDYCERLLIASPSSSRASPTKPGQSRRSFVHAPVNSHRHARADARTLACRRAEDVDRIGATRKDPHQADQKQTYDNSFHVRHPCWGTLYRHHRASFQPVRGLYSTPDSTQRDAAEGPIGIIRSDLIKSAFIAFNECPLVRQRPGAGALPRTRGSSRHR